MAFDVPEALLGSIARDAVFMQGDGEIDCGLPEDTTSIDMDFTPDHDTMRIDDAEVEGRASRMRCGTGCPRWPGGGLLGESVPGSRTRAEWIDIIGEMLALAGA